MLCHQQEDYDGDDDRDDNGNNDNYDYEDDNEDHGNDHDVVDDDDYQEDDDIEGDDGHQLLCLCQTVLLSKILAVGTSWNELTDFLIKDFNCRTFMNDVGRPLLDFG